MRKSLVCIHCADAFAPSPTRVEGRPSLPIGPSAALFQLVQFHTLPPKFTTHTSCTCINVCPCLQLLSRPLWPPHRTPRPDLLLERVHGRNHGARGAAPQDTLPGPNLQGRQRCTFPGGLEGAPRPGQNLHVQPNRDEHRVCCCVLHALPALSAAAWHAKAVWFVAAYCTRHLH